LRRRKAQRKERARRLGGVWTSVVLRENTIIWEGKKQFHKNLKNAMLGAKEKAMKKEKGPNRPSRQEEIGLKGRLKTQIGPLREKKQGGLTTTPRRAKSTDEARLSSRGVNVPKSLKRNSQFEKKKKARRWTQKTNSKKKRDPASFTRAHVLSFCRKKSITRKKRKRPPEKKKLRTSTCGREGLNSDTTLLRLGSPRGGFKQIPIKTWKSGEGGGKQG